MVKKARERTGIGNAGEVVRQPRGARHTRSRAAFGAAVRLRLELTMSVIEMVKKTLIVFASLFLSASCPLLHGPATIHFRRAFSRSPFPPFIDAHASRLTAGANDLFPRAIAHTPCHGLVTTVL